MFTFIMTLVGAFFGAVFGITGVVLYDRFKRPPPNYDFDFEKEVSYQTTVSRPFFGGVNIQAPATEYFENYICIKNYGTVPLHNITTKIHFDKKKERRYYQTMEIREELFDLEVEYLEEYSPTIELPTFLPNEGRNEVFEERTKQGFFIPDSAMEKLKRLSPIKVRVEYTWENKKGSDIWLFDFSDENEVRFSMPPPTFWEKTKLIFKKIF